jgi:hypothetical protein
MKVREVERFWGLVERRCDRFRVRVRTRNVVVGKVVETVIQGPNCPLPS